MNKIVILAGISKKKTVLFLVEEVFYFCIGVKEEKNFFNEEKPGFLSS